MVASNRGLFVVRLITVDGDQFEISGPPLRDQYEAERIAWRVAFYLGDMEAAGGLGLPEHVRDIQETLEALDIDPDTCVVQAFVRIATGGSHGWAAVGNPVAVRDFAFGERVVTPSTRW